MKPTHIATYKHSGERYYLLDDGSGLVKYAYARGEEVDTYLWNKTGKIRIDDFNPDVWDIERVVKFKGNK